MWRRAGALRVRMRPERGRRARQPPQHCVDAAKTALSATRLKRPLFQTHSAQKAQKTALKRRQRQCGHHGRIHGARQGGSSKKAGKARLGRLSGPRRESSVPRRRLRERLRSVAASAPFTGLLPVWANIFLDAPAAAQNDQEPRAGASGSNGVGKLYKASRYSRAMSSGPTSRGLLAGLPLASASRAMIPH